VGTYNGLFVVDQVQDGLCYHRKLIGGVPSVKYTKRPLPRLESRLGPNPTETRKRLRYFRACFDGSGGGVEEFSHYVPVQSVGPSQPRKPAGRGSNRGRLLQVRRKRSRELRAQRREEGCCLDGVVRST
jgi:hypothetical protein